MATEARRRFLIDPLPGHPTEIGAALWAAEEVRARTLRTVAGLSGDQLDTRTDASPNTLGTLLYHVAHTEMKWLFLLDGPEPTYPEAVSVWLPHAYPREVCETLPPALGEDLDEHAERLEATRRVFLARFEAMTLADYRRPIRTADFELSPQWVLQHCAEHEAHHRGQIAQIRAALSG